MLINEHDHEFNLFPFVHSLLQLYHVFVSNEISKYAGSRC